MILSFMSYIAYFIVIHIKQSYQKKLTTFLFLRGTHAEREYIMRQWWSMVYKLIVYTSYKINKIITIR